MQDSPGKRLGAKKYENHQVKIGQILYRQRGTKWYPGVNVGIGKDHTLFALQPGFVKYYLDPFHPKRKFIGIALNKDDKLPYPHFEPTKRRLGRDVLDGKKAEFEANYLPRSFQLLQPKINEELNKRIEKRNIKFNNFKDEIKKNFPNLSSSLTEEQLDLAANRLLSIDGYLRGGKSIDDARFSTTYYYIYDLKLSNKRNEISIDELNTKSSNYKEFASKIDSEIMFAPDFSLTKNLTSDELSSLKTKSFAELEKLIPDITKPINKKTKELALSIINSVAFSLKEQIKLKRRFLKPTLPETNETIGNAKDKKVIAIQKMNIETRQVETIYRTKNAFLP